MAGKNNADEDAKEHPRNEWYDYEPSKIGRAIAAIVIYGVFIFLDIDGSFLRFRPDPNADPRVAATHAPGFTTGLRNIQQDYQETMR
jgi:hypothetical protein